MGQKIGTIVEAGARLWVRGIVGIVTLVFAVMACYGLFALTALLPLIGVRLALDSAAWAGTIVMFAVLTALAVLPGFRRHRSAVPGLGALAGCGLILYALLIDYRVLTELVGFVLLAGAVLVDASVRRNARRGVSDTSAGTPAE